LESFANVGSANPKIQLQIPKKRHGKLTILDTSSFIKQIMQLQSDFKSPDLVFAAHRALGQALADVAIQSAQKRGISKIGFSGGVAYNKILTRMIRTTIEDQGLTFLIHSKVPPGDAGTSVGQALVARSSIQ
jgi:hydrogenase maturation protein HypF